MSDSSGLKLEGLPLDQPALASHGLTVPHRIFQPHELTIAGLFLPATLEDRGWPEPSEAARINPIRVPAIQRLRSVISDVFVLASRAPSRFSRQSVVSGMEQSLLGTIDHAYLTAPGERSAPIATGKHVRTCRRVDEFIRCNTMPSSADVAAAAGVTIRTLHNAMVAVHGMSLQKFMILNRLWAVRAALLRSSPESRVKTIAFDHGFWHLGRFSRTYRTFFGEFPSDTLRQFQDGPPA